ncbi:MAG: hypothetical protein LQ351_004650 [Letrouitia transgressa]|nr:MAG: hypothetical protein LQ351_004650 [Letrouitia transgressa]
MQSLQLLPFQCPRPITLQLCQAQFRKIHDGRRGPWTKTKKPYWKKKPLSLHEELFPEEANLTSDTQSTSVPKNTQFSHLPRLDVGPAKKPQSHDEARQSEAARAASQGAYRHWDLAVLVGGKLSRSLTDNDFRRIAPKGRHIDGWTGVGDILKTRDPQTFQQLGHYYLLFPNPAYARTYQHHVSHVHRTAQTYTPTSLESPLPPAPGLMSEGVDLYSMLQDYALYPPSQKISLRSVFSPYAQPVKELLRQRGYRQIMEPTDKTGRAVLLWADGLQLSARMIRAAIDKDGRDRGLEWALEHRDRGAVTQVQRIEQPSAEEAESSSSSSSSREVESQEPQRSNGPAKWIVSFQDENEARRFVRLWHMKPLPHYVDSNSSARAAAPLHVELIW